MLTHGLGARGRGLDRLRRALRGRLDVVSDGGGFIRQAGLLVLPSTPEDAPTAAEATAAEAKAASAEAKAAEAKPADAKAAAQGE